MKTFPELFRAFYLEPLGLEENAMLTAHYYLWPRLTGKVNVPAMLAEDPQPDRPPPASNRMSGTMAHLRRTIAGPEVNWSGDGPFIKDERYFWSVDGRADTAVIPLYGMISKGAGPFAESCLGAVNPDRIAHALGQALQAKAVTNVIFDVGSPGGRTAFIPELAAMIREATETSGKTLYAFTDEMMASAAVWLASQVDEVVVTPSARVGSIGTYLAWLNPKVAMDKEGYKLELFKAGTHKALGLPGTDLTEEDAKYLQGTVDKINGEFVAAVKNARPMATEEALRDAKVYDGWDAVKHGLADHVAASWDDFISAL